MTCGTAKPPPPAPMALLTPMCRCTAWAGLVASKFGACFPSLIPRQGRFSFIVSTAATAPAPISREPAPPARLRQLINPASLRFVLWGHRHSRSLADFSRLTGFLWVPYFPRGHVVELSRVVLLMD